MVLMTKFHTRLTFFLLIGALFGASHQLHAATPFANVFTTEIYDISGLSDESTDEEKVKYFVERKFAWLKKVKIDPLMKAIQQKEKENETQDNTAIWTAGGAGGGAAILVSNFIAFPVGAVVSAYGVLVLGARLLSGGRPTYFNMTLEAPGIVLGYAFMPIYYAMRPGREDLQEIKDMKTEGRDLIEALVTGVWEELLELECLYINRKSHYPEGWATKIERLFLQAYCDEDFSQKDLITSMIDYPFTLKSFTPQQRASLLQNYEPGSVRWELVAKLTDVAKPFYAHVQIDNQDLFETRIAEIKETLGLPLIIKDAAQIDQMIGDNIDEQAVIDLFYGTNSEKGIWLSALSNSQNAQNPILVIKNADEWIQQGNPKLAWLMKLTDRNARTFDSPYYGCRVNWSHLNIIFMGAAPLDQAAQAFISRIGDNSYYDFDS